MPQGNGKRFNASSTLPDLNDFAHGAAVGDIDRDGDRDIFVGNFLGTGEYGLPDFLLNDGSGLFAVMPRGSRRRADLLFSLVRHPDY